ncbi:MAG: sigma 54-interacting transcriptional regulator [Clostridiales Family XIII bacterium]|jgi:transcriptional regulator with PAS, ATPase and Fis domain|nr:sigma 54-interacting transcriptional regulator [Clostridiales Family XIII bacterium]
MLDAMEKDLHIRLKEKSKKHILNVFRLGMASQLPVLDGGKVVGILDLFVFLNNQTGAINVEELMEKDIVVAGIGQNVFSFRRSKQMILPFVDEQENYVGFINRYTFKCYLPSKEYLEVIERDLPSFEEEDAIDFAEVADSFRALFETNYDGLYITVGKGKTVGVNTKAEMVTLSQILQNKKEISISDEVYQDGGAIRVITQSYDSKQIRMLRDYEQITEEISEMRSLREKYQSELELLNWTQSATHQIVAESPEMKQILNIALRVAKVDATVLMQGDSGTGKSRIAALIHSNSDRKDGPFIKIDCGSIPESLLESELFGYLPGAFTGAEKGGKTGLVELANGGTLFLDEIAEVPLNLQAKLLRLLQDREIVKVGGNKTIHLDIRIIAATNRDLQQMVSLKLFRKDLFYRLSVVPVTIPPLRNRQEDIGPLIAYYLKLYNKKYGMRRRLDRKTLKILLDYSWPGNIRELQNLVEYLIATAATDDITQEDLPEGILKSTGKRGAESLAAPAGGSLKAALDSVEKRLLVEAMRKTHSTEEMAKLLQVDRSTIIRKLKKHQLKSHFD